MTTAPADPSHSRFARLNPKAYLALQLLAGVAFTALLLWGFAAIADAIGDKGRFIQIDAGITSFIQHHDTEWGETIFNAISWLGATGLAVSVIAATAAYAYRRRWHHAAFLSLGYLSAIALNQLLKHFFHRGRPEFATEFIKHASWSFPSGHAMDSMVGYGIVIVLLLEGAHTKRRRSLIWVAGVLLIALVGFSRVYLGVHYLSDVVAGWLAGGAWLFACVSAYRFAKRRAVGQE